MAVNVCTGGTASAGVSSLTFTNELPEPVTITSCTMPGWPSPPQANPVIPQAQNGVAGSGTVQLRSRTVKGTYDFTTIPDCNTIGTNPQIKVS